MLWIPFHVLKAQKKYGSQDPQIEMEFCCKKFISSSVLKGLVSGWVGVFLSLESIAIAFWFHIY